MTEIMIQDGVVQSLPTEWEILAWDSTRNNSNATQINNASAFYSIWNEYKLFANNNVISTYNQEDVNAEGVTYNAIGSDLDGSILKYYGMEAPVWTYNGDAYNINGILAFGGVLQLSFASTAVDLRQLLVSIGSATSGNEPSWAYASMNYWYHASNSHDYIECRVGVTIKKVKVNNFDKTLPHLYTIYRDSTDILFYVDNLFLASIPLLSTSDPLWSSENQNEDFNSWWVFSDYGYIPSAGTVASYTNAYTLFVILSDFSAGVDHPPLVDLCKYRYGITVGANTASTQTTTLTGSEIAVFGSSNFSTVFI